jgi:type 1 fimbria pilin
MFQKIGKYTALCGSSLLIVMAAATAQAADGQVEFTGTINDNACTINSESVKKAVDMGQVRIADFPNTVGAVATAGATPFSISLENCSGSTLKNASIKFSGQQSGTDATVLGMTGDNQVSGVGIQINDAPLVTSCRSTRPATTTFCARSPTRLTSPRPMYAWLPTPKPRATPRVYVVSAPVKSIHWPASTLPTSNS